MVVEGDRQAIERVAGGGGIEGAGGEIGVATRRGTERLDAVEDDGGAVFNGCEETGQLGPVFSRRVLERLRRVAQRIGAKISGGAGDRVRVPGRRHAIARCHRRAQGVQCLVLSIGKSQQDPLEAGTVDLETPHRAADVDPFEHRV